MNTPPNYVSVGRHTYSGDVAWHRWGTENIKIGRYCSISQQVKILAGGNHRTDVASTFPFDTILGLKHPSAPERSYALGGDIEVGNDVWIGFGASLMGSMKIGHGAVIAANATVFSDIPPYAIAVGNPARVNKYRFSEEIIAALLRIAWWNWPDEWVRARVDHFYWPIEKFVEEYNKPAATCKQCGKTLAMIIPAPVGECGGDCVLRRNVA